MRIFQVDAFTRRRFTGNPATVVLDADGLEESELLAIAREFCHAETAFVARAAAPDHHLRLRFFNARKEMPFVGHATIAAHAALLAAGRRTPGMLRQQSGTGVIEVCVAIRADPRGDEPQIEFRQPAPRLAAPLPLKSTLLIAEALRLPVQGLHEHWPARIARAGGTRLLVPVAQAGVLASLAPNMDTLAALGTDLGADGVFVFACARTETGLVTESRMFCPALGIPEDPVSGNAHGMLGAYLLEAGELGDARGLSFTGHQGASLRRPGEVGVRLELERNAASASTPALAAVHIGGSAVIVSEGRLR